MLTAIREFFARYSAWIWSYLEPLGSWGVFGIAAVDAAFMGLPLDPVVASYVYAQPHLFWLYVLMASAGSALGSSVLYAIGHKGGELLLHKSGPRHMIERFRARFARQQFLALMIPAILPPPTPLKLFMLAAAVFGMSYRMFLLAIFAGRVIRFSLLSVLTIMFGPQIVRVTKLLLREHLPLVLATVAAALLIWLLVRKYRRGDEASVSKSAAGLFDEVEGEDIMTKTCPHCAETDLQPGAKICKHCGKNVQTFHRKPIGWAVIAVLFGLAGFFFWPLWIAAGFFLLLQLMQKA